MKLIITEDQRFSIIKRYWDKLTSQGKDPSIGDMTFKLFHFDEMDLNVLQKFLVEYLGGYETAIKKTIGMLENLPPIDLDTGDLPSKWKYTETQNIGKDSIGVNILVFGKGVHNAVDEMDMSEYFEFKDYIDTEIETNLYEMVTTKTGIDIYITNIDYANK